MALLTGEPRAATVVAKTNCALLALSRTDFEQLLGPLRVALDETFCYRTLANIGILAKVWGCRRGRCCARGLAWARRSGRASSHDIIEERTQCIRKSHNRGAHIMHQKKSPAHAACSPKHSTHTHASGALFGLCDRRIPRSAAQRHTGLRHDTATPAFAAAAP